MAESHVTTKANSAADIKAQFGNFLRQAREKSGLSIEAVAQETKISKQFIIYLETGSVENLPGQVFGRGFIKNIARYLRSDSSEMLRLYDACWGVESTPQEVAASEHITTKKAAVVEDEAIAAPVIAKNPGFAKRKADAEEAPKILKKETVSSSPTDSDRERVGVVVPAWLVRSIVSPHVRLGILGSIAAIMVICVFGRWMIAHNSQQVAHKSASTEVAANPIANKAAAESSDANQIPAADVAPVEVVPGNVVEKSITAPVDVAGATGTKVEAVEKVPAAVLPSTKEEDSPLQVQQGSAVAFDQVLELNISAPVEIKMTVDGKKQENTSFKADQHRFTFHDRAEMMISDASAVEVIYNGKSLGVLGNKGRKRRIFFQAKPSEADFPH